MNNLRNWEELGFVFLENLKILIGWSNWSGFHLETGNRTDQPLVPRVGIRN